MNIGGLSYISVAAVMEQVVEHLSHKQEFESWAFQT
jgi:hypothetical protein